MRAGVPSFRSLWARRVGWLVLLWTAGVLVIAIVAMIFRLLMNFAGMTT